MKDGPALQPEFWDTLAEHVRAKVAPALRQRPSVRKPVIAYLRDLEALARRECHSREVIHLIASGRRVLGDREDVEPQDGPFARN
jgi:hypothetical protein